MKHRLTSLAQGLATTRRHSNRAARKDSGAMALADQMDIVRGRKLSLPTRSLRRFEAQLLSLDKPSVQVMHKTLCIDHGQVSQPAVEQEAPPIISSGEYLPRDSTPPPIAYAPEFSAPDAGRFQVESFDDGMPAPPVAEPAEPAFPPAANPAPATASPPPDETPCDLRTPAQEPSASSRKAMPRNVALAKDEFERDLESILGGKPKQEESASPLSAAPGDSAESPPDTGQTPPARPNHEVFDRMGLGMRHANSFNLGKVNLNKRFDQLEAALALEPNQPSASREIDAGIGRDPATPDTFDLVAELAEIDQTRPPPPTADQPIREVEVPDQRSDQNEEETSRVTRPDVSGASEDETTSQPDCKGEHDEQSTGRTGNNDRTASSPTGETTAQEADDA